MYTPSKKGSNKGGATIKASNNQTGGDYITATYDPSSLTMADIKLSTYVDLVGSTVEVSLDSSEPTVSSLLGLADVSSFDAITSLSIAQISRLIDEIEGQLRIEDGKIVQNKIDSARIQGDIDRIPGGYQNAYDVANEQYISVATAYSTALSILEHDKSTLSSKMDSMAHLSTLSSIYRSSILGYQSEYSSIWQGMQSNEAIIQREESTYKGKLSTYMDYLRDDSKASEDLSTTRGFLKYNSSILSTATYNYNSMSTIYGTLLNQYITTSTYTISTSRYYTTSTNKYMNNLIAQKSTQAGSYNSTSLAYGNTQAHAGNLSSLYRTALAVEESTIMKYNELENILESLLYKGPQSQCGGGRDLNYYITATPPAGQELTYQTTYMMLSTMSTTVYSTTRVRLSLEVNQANIFQDALKSILDAADVNISSAKWMYNLASINESCVSNNLSTLYAKVGPAQTTEYEYLSTMSSFKTIYLNDISTYNSLSTTVGSYKSIENVLSSYLASTLFTLGLLGIRRASYSSDLAIYTGAYTTWSTLESTSLSTINGYSTIKGLMEDRVRTLNDEIGALNQSLLGEFGNLTGKASAYYANVRIDLNNELDAYKYGVQEWNSFIGYICSELLIQKLNLYTSIDSITFQLQVNITASQKASLVSQRSGYGNKQTTIQGIINVLNVLDSKFDTLLEVIRTERENKSRFVDTRSELTTNEITVLQDNTQHSAVQQQYTTKMGILNERVTSINSNINTRNTQMKALYDIINPQLSILDGLGLAFSYTRPDSLSVTIGPFNLDKTEYMLLPQLNYGLNATTEQYKLVVTNLEPGTLTGTGTLPNIFYQGV